MQQYSSAAVVAWFDMVTDDSARTSFKRLHHMHPDAGDVAGLDIVASVDAKCNSSSVFTRLVHTLPTATCGIRSCLSFLIVKADRLCHSTAVSACEIQGAVFGWSSG